MTTRIPNRSLPPVPPGQVLLTYVAHLEVEVDRLRNEGRFIQQEVLSALRQIRALAANADPESAPDRLAQAEAVAVEVSEVLRDVREAPGYHPSFDQVIAIAVRPLLEKVFRAQQRLEAAPQVQLRLDLQCEHVEWFPARLRHLFGNLLSNALRFRDPAKEESWVKVELREAPQVYEFRVSDNGQGMPEGRTAEVFDLLYRAAPARAAGLGVGLAVVKLLVEQSAGTLTLDSGEGQGTSVAMTLPRYEIDDFLL